MIHKLFGVEKASKANRNELLNILYSQLANQRHIVFYDFDKVDYIKQGYQSNAEVYKIIRKLVDKCGYPPTYLYEDKGTSQKYKQFRKATNPIDSAKGKIWRAKSLEFVDGENDLSELINNPNNYQSWGELMELFRVFYFLQGEAFLYRETAINSDIALSLHVAPANHMQPVFSRDKENIIEGWKLTISDDTDRTLDARDVFHLKMTNPHFDLQGSQLRGQSPLLAGLKYLQLSDKAIEAWLKSMENEGAKGLISPNHNNPNLWLTPEQVEQTETSVETKVHGLSNRNKVVVSGMPLQYTQIGLSPDALAIIQALDKSQVNLADLWGVPAVLFDPNPTYSNQAEASKRFVSEVVIPYLEKEEQKLNSWLVEPFSRRDNKKYYLDNDTSVYPELKVSLDERSSLAKILTINEMRIMEGYDTIDLDIADEVFIEGGKVPLSDYDSNFEL